MAGSPPPPYASVLAEGRDSFFLPVASSQQQQQHLQGGASTSSGGGGPGANHREFDVVVADPLKQGDGVTAYVCYKVRTRTSHPRYRTTSEVTRRFSDFASLHERLVEKNKGVIVPPMPEKGAFGGLQNTVMQKYQLAADFIEARRRALQVFICKVCAHPVLRDSKELQTFLEADEEAWMLEAARVQGEQSVTKAPVGGAVAWLKGLQQSAQSLMLAGGRADESGEDAEYLKVRDYINSLESHLLEAHRQAGRLVRKETEVAGALAEFGVAAEQLGKYDEGSAMRAAFDALASRAASVASLSKSRADAMSGGFEAPLKEAARSIRSVQAAMADRSAALAAFMQAKSDVETRKIKIARLRGAPGLNEEKMSQVERELVEADSRVKTTRMAYEMIASRMTEELNRFQKERAADMTSVLREFALAQARHAADTSFAWTGFLNELQAQPVA